MSKTHIRRAVLIALGTITLGACAYHDHDRWDDGDRRDHWQRDRNGWAYDPNGRRDWNDRDHRDKDRDGHDQDWR